MVLKAYKEETFKANIKFLDDNSVKEVVFRLPRNTDVYSSSDGNKNLELLKTYGNMAKPFDKPVQMEDENGSILNIMTLSELIEYGVKMDFSDVSAKWAEKISKIEEEKERLVKKSKSVGNSTRKDIQETNA